MNVNPIRKNKNSSFLSKYGSILFILQNTRKYSHFLFLSISALFFIIMDRRHEYMHRLDYQWKRQLKSEQVRNNNAIFIFSDVISVQIIMHTYNPNELYQFFCRHRSKRQQPNLSTRCCYKTSFHIMWLKGNNEFHVSMLHT